jgi:RHS repeat-associated protein
MREFFAPPARQQLQCVLLRLRQCPRADELHRHGHRHLRLRRFRKFDSLDWHQTEQHDPDLRLYCNRARYLNVSTGRFWTMDTFEGRSQEPLSLHKYLYAGANPVNHIDRRTVSADAQIEELQ